MLKLQFDTLNKVVDLRGREHQAPPEFKARKQTFGSVTAQLTLTGPFAELLRTVETLERRLPACRLRSAEWQTATRPRTRRTQLTLTLYIQQLTLITESK